VDNLLTFIKKREFEILIGIGAVATILSFILDNKDIFNYGILFFIYWFDFNWDEELLKKEK
jgi:hypothetical protein